jgi:Flp pilus assembly protein TadG
MRDRSEPDGKRKVTYGRNRGERGADVLEAAFVLPILLTLVFALYSFGRGWDIYQTMTRAAREGVHEAVTTSCAMCGNSYTPATGPGSIQSDIVFPALQAAGINTSNSVLTTSYHQGVTVLDQSGSVCGAYITFSYPYNLTVPFLPWTLTTITLTTKVQMRYENMPTTCTPS